MPSRTEALTPTTLRNWELPSGAGSKDDRGRVVIIGGARRSPGAAMLSGLAALRVGAGRLTIAVAESVAAQVAVAVPESGVIPLEQTAAGAVRGSMNALLRQEFERADAVVIGPGLDDADEARLLLAALAAEISAPVPVLLDAYALGVLPDVADDTAAWRGRLVLTPNEAEAARLLGRDVDDRENDVRAIAQQYGAVTSCFGLVGTPDGRLWEQGSGQAGLGTSGSGDVLAGAIGGLLARGATPEQAACWGTHLHATAGDRLAARIGPTGYLARELVDGLPLVLAELGQRA